MKQSILATATGVAAMLGLAPSAFAQEGLYVGGGYSMF